MAWRDRFIPLIVACPLFLQNLDTSVMATALPAIADALDVPALQLNLAITAYLLSIAVFLPLSGWCADRFGARRVFCWAIGLFAAGSTLCAMADSLGTLVAFRIVQGLGGALMVPVARLILLRSVGPAAIVAAMVWFTVPPTIGRMAGPLFGGAIVTWTSWRWIFLVNLPFGLAGILLALRFLPEQPAEGPRQPFDLTGFALLAAGLAGVVAALETAGKGLIPPWSTAAFAAAGSAALIAYAVQSRRREHPLIDLGILRLRTYRTSVLGGTPLRIAIGASPFLLPLMLQLGFGLSPLDSGLLTVATALGSLSTRAVVGRLIRVLGFRRLLIGATTVTSLMYASYGLFRADTPHLLIFCTLLFGGLINSMSMVAMQSLGFADVPKPRMSHATTLATMVQQLSISLGVVLGAALVTVAARFNGSPLDRLEARDFPFAFLMVGLLTLLSLLSFVRLRPEDGEALRGRQSSAETKANGGGGRRGPARLRSSATRSDPPGGQAMLNWNDVLGRARNGNPEPAAKVTRSLAEWREQLAPDVFEVTRQSATERPFSSEMCTVFTPGRYACACCGALLFDAEQKFESGTGWPSFTKPVDADAVAYHADDSYGMTRIEAICNTCDAHLGHVFPDGPPPTGLRYCINALALEKRRPGL